MAQAKRRQKFFNVEMPIINKETQLYGYDFADFNGRTISYDLTRLLKGKNAILKLLVKADEKKATAVPKEFKILPYFIRRMMRKGTNYVEDSFSAECKDTTLKIKPFLITRKKVSRAVRKALRDKAKEKIQEYIKDKESEILFDEIMKNKFQKQLSSDLKKIYPLSFCEIRTLKVEKWKKGELNGN